MAYGTSSLDLSKGVVLLSCIFNVFMTVLIAQDPISVIFSPNGGGWWSPLKTIAETDPNVGIYPRIWATFLVFQLFVRVNWVFTVETSPSLYRCVLLSYLLPFVQYMLESQYYKSLPPFDPVMALVMIGPWFAIIVGYAKYTKESVETKSKKK